MHIIASFEHSTNLELALTELVHMGIVKEKILAVPLNQKRQQQQLLDSIHRSDGISLFDAAAPWGTIFSLLGAIYGFILPWGPILWGLIGAVTGFIFGVIIDFLISKKKQSRKSNLTTEVFVAVDCSETQSPLVEKILWENFALRIGRLI